MAITLGNQYGASSDYVIGGASLAMFFAYVAAGATAADKVGALIIQFDLTEETSIEYNDNGGITVELTQLRADPWAKTFFNTYRPSGTDSTESVKLENNLALIGEGENVEAGKELIGAFVGGRAKRENVREVVVAFGGLQMSTGSNTWSADTLNRPTVSFISSAAPAAIEIVAADLQEANLTTITASLNGATAVKEDNQAGTADSGMECLAEGYLDVEATTGTFTGAIALASGKKYTSVFITQQDA